MLSIKKILVPTDFSDNAATAYNVAHQLAKRFGAKVDFINIIETLTHYSRGLAKLEVPDNQKELYPQLKKQASHKIASLMDDYLKLENKGEGVVKVAARPFQAIANHAEGGEYDLIVMATLGEDDSNFLIGSVAEKVIRYSKIPVLSTGTSNLDTIENVLLPTDGSKLSFKALPMSLSIALIFNAEITLLHVVELDVTTTESARSRSRDEKIRNVIYRTLQEFLSHSWDRVELRRGNDFESQLVYKDGASSRTINAKLVIERGVSAHHTITQYAAENADIGIMTTHGRSGLAHVFIGSTAENVARHVKLPLITVKPDFDEIPPTGQSN